MSINPERCMRHRHRFRYRGDLVALTELKEGDRAFVVEIRGDKKIVQRLSDLGITPNSSLTVTRTAPVDGPIEVEVRGSKLILGKDIAKNVIVKIE